MPQKCRELGGAAELLDDLLRVIHADCYTYFLEFAKHYYVFLQVR